MNTKTTGEEIANTLVIGFLTTLAILFIVLLPPCWFILIGLLIFYVVGTIAKLLYKLYLRWS